MAKIFKAESSMYEALLELRETNSGYSAYVGSFNGPNSVADENISILLDKRTIEFIDSNYGIIKLLNEIQKLAEKNSEFVNGTSFLRKNLTSLIKQKFDELVEQNNELPFGDFEEVTFKEEETEDKYTLTFSDLVLDIETIEEAVNIAKFNKMNFEVNQNGSYSIFGFQAKKKAKELYEVLKGEKEFPADCKYLFTNTSKIYVEVDLILDTETYTEGQRIAKLNGLELTTIPEGETYIIGDRKLEDKAYKLLEVLKGDLQAEYSTLVLE